MSLSLLALISCLHAHEVAIVIAEPLTKLYNESLCSGIVPTEWKQSHITPVYKGGATDNPSNYRPIVVVSVVAKILEKIVATQLSNHLVSNNIIYSIIKELINMARLQKIFY